MFFPQERGFDGQLLRYFPSKVRVAQNNFRILPTADFACERPLCIPTIAIGVVSHFHGYLKTDHILPIHTPSTLVTTHLFLARPAYHPIALSWRVFRSFPHSQLTHSSASTLLNRRRQTKPYYVRNIIMKRVS